MNGRAKYICMRLGLILHLSNGGLWGRSSFILEIFGKQRKNFNLHALIYNALTRAQVLFNINLQTKPYMSKIKVGLC